MINSVGRSTSRKPSAYPPLPFHLLRLGQLVSSIIVGSVLVFFVHHIRDEGFSVPWTFLLVRLCLFPLLPRPHVTEVANALGQLLTVSIFTILALLHTTLLHFTRSLAPRVDLLANSALSALWILGLALLTWNLGWTLGHRCIAPHWRNEPGIMVCRLYKALTAFTVTGLACSLVALGLDLRTHRRVTQLGKYNQMLDIKAPKGNMRSSSPFHMGGDEWETGFGDGKVGGNTVREPSHDGARPYKVQKPIEAQQFGYAAPVEQTSYGGSGERWL